MDDVIFFNLHRRYVNHQPGYGGFLGIYQLAAFLKENVTEEQVAFKLSWDENGDSVLSGLDKDGNEIIPEVEENEAQNDHVDA